jgi:hypothetical protein
MMNTQQGRQEPMSAQEVKDLICFHADRLTISGAMYC